MPRPTTEWTRHARSGPDNITVGGTPVTTQPTPPNDTPVTIPGTDPNTLWNTVT
jgi:hypothetical protein